MTRFRSPAPISFRIDRHTSGGVTPLMDDVKRTPRDDVTGGDVCSCVVALLCGTGCSWSQSCVSGGAGWLCRSVPLPSGGVAHPAAAQGHGQGQYRVTVTANTHSVAVKASTCCVCQTRSNGIRAWLHGGSFIVSVFSSQSLFRFSLRRPNVPQWIDSVSNSKKRSVKHRAV